MSAEEKRQNNLLNSLERDGESGRARASTEGHKEGLEEATEVDKWVLPADDEVHQHQGDKEVDEETRNDRQHVETKTADSAHQVVDADDFTDDQEHDTDGGVPKGMELKHSHSCRLWLHKNTI